VDVEELWSSLVGPERRRVPAVGRVAAVVGHLAARPAGESWLEDQFIDLLTAAGIPLPETQVWIVVDGHRYRVDTCWSRNASWWSSTGTSSTAPGSTGAAMPSGRPA
jgi:hypothetical protein